GDVKEYYYSNGGMLNLDNNTVTPEGGLTEQHASAMGKEPFQLPATTLTAAAGAVTSADTGADPMTSAHMRNWMDCVRSRQRPNADIEAAYNHSVALCMTIAALHSGKKITFDAAAKDVVAS